MSNLLLCNVSSHCVLTVDLMLPSSGDKVLQHLRVLVCLRCDAGKPWLCSDCSALICFFFFAIFRLYAGCFSKVCTAVILFSFILINWFIYLFYCKIRSKPNLEVEWNAVLIGFLQMPFSLAIQTIFKCVFCYNVIHNDDIKFRVTVVHQSIWTLSV